MRCPLLLFLGAAVGLSAQLPEGYQQILLGRNASDQLVTAANHLADFLERDFGSRPTLRHMPMTGRPVGILIMTEADHRAFDSNPLTDEIIIERKGGGLQISGSDNTATCFAVYRFIEHCLGWRYYAPGELGLEKLDPPPNPPEAVGDPEILLHDQAKFYSRNLYAIGTAGHSPDWQLWNGLRERFSFNHTLQQVLDPSLFTQNPDWFAKDEHGVPMKPPFDTPHGYNNHPDLSHPDVRNHVVTKTLDALKTYGHSANAEVYPPVLRSPGVISTSISLGDSFVFGTYPDSYNWRPRSYFRRWPDWANHVFDYSNAIARDITEGWRKMNEKQSTDTRLYLGALSYLNWENVPDFTVDSSIIPFLTFDRSQWYDRNARENDLQLVSKWSTNGPEFLGTWDYLFSYGFLIPRSMRGVVGDSIPALHKSGVRAYFSQIGAQWPYDAHTNYLTARLLWNPDRDAEELMEELFNEYYGPASVEMHAFFSDAESIWMKQKEAGWWLRYWKDPWQAALWTESDIERLQDHLDLASRKAENYGKMHAAIDRRASRYLDRINETRALYGITRLFIAYQKACWELQSVDWENASNQTLYEGLQEVIRCRELKGQLISKAEILSNMSTRIGRANELDWIFKYDSLDATEKTILVMLENADAKAFGLWRKSILRDKRFDRINDPEIWHHQFMDSVNQVRQSEPDGSGYMVQNIRRGHVYQLFETNEGADYLALLDLETSQSPTGEVYLEIAFFDEANNQLAVSPRSRIAPTSLYGDKQRIRATLKAPAKSKFGRIKIRFFELDPECEVKLEWVDVLRLDLENP